MPWLWATPLTAVAVLANADVATTVRGADEASTRTPVARLANTLLSSVGPALLLTSMPMPRGLLPPNTVLLMIRPKGTTAGGTAPVVASPLNRIPPVPLEATTLLATTTPGTSRLVLRTGRLRATPGWGMSLSPSRPAASMLMP